MHGLAAMSFLIAIMLFQAVMADATGFKESHSVSACSSGSLFKLDYQGLGCYPDNHDPQYYEAVHQQQAELIKRKLYLYGGLAAVAGLVLVGAVVNWAFCSKRAVSDAKRA